MSVEPVTIACVVEGHGEVKGLPKLLFRIAQQFPVVDLRVPIPHRIPRGSLVAARGIENAVEAQARRVRTAGGVLVLLDADDDCPAHLGPTLLRRARAARPDKLVSVILPKREFEGWFLAAAASLSGQCGLPDDIVAPQDPEGIRDAKGWLSERRTDGLSYRPTVDQPILGSAFDMGQARLAAPSFDKFCRDVEKLLGVEKYSNLDLSRP
jgi:Domain of unknown function (DUF4276)